MCAKSIQRVCSSYGRGGGCAGTPGHVPRDEAGRVRFMVDSMAEGLAHQLRLCGVDAATIPVGPKGQRHRAYRCLILRIPLP